MSDSWLLASAEKHWSAEVDDKLQLSRIRPTASQLSPDSLAALEPFLCVVTGAPYFSVELANTGLDALELRHVLRTVGFATDSCGCVCSRLNLSGNYLSDEAAKEIADFVSGEAAVIEELDLSGNAFTAFGLAELCAALTSCASKVTIGIDSEDPHGCARSPCWLDLRGNMIDRPLEAFSLLSGHGISACLGLQCSRRRCVRDAAVHLAGALACQVGGTPWDNEELLQRLGALATSLPRPMQRRKPLLTSWAKTVPPWPAAHEGQQLPRAQAWSTWPPVMRTEQLCSSKALEPQIPQLQPQRSSPLTLEFGSAPQLQRGQLVQATRDCSASKGGQQHAAHGLQAHTFASGAVLRIVSAPAVSLWAWGRVQVINSLPGQQHFGSAWVNVNDVAPEPALQ